MALTFMKQQERRRNWSGCKEEFARKMTKMLN